jgi:hypothetical protein
MEDYVRFLERPGNVSDVAPSRLGMSGTTSGDLMNVKLQGSRIQDVSNGKSFMIFKHVRILSNQCRLVYGANLYGYIATLS